MIDYDAALAAFCSNDQAMSQPQLTSRMKPDTARTFRPLDVAIPATPVPVRKRTSDNRAAQRILRLPSDLVPLFFFLHIPKTAGTSMRQVFKQMFRDRYLLVEKPNGRKDGKRACDEPDYFDGVLLAGGHFIRTSPIARAVRRRRIVFVSTVRDPVRRVISYYDYLRLKPDHPLYADVCDRTLFEAFTADTPFRKACINEQLRILFGAGPKADPKLRLETENYIIGAPNNLHQMAAVIASLSGVRPVDKIPVINTLTECGGEKLLQARDQPDFDDAVEAIGAANTEEQKLAERAQKGVIVNLPGWHPLVPRFIPDW